MNVGKIIQECKFLHDIYIPEDPCRHCRVSKRTCQHASKILKVKRPFEYTIKPLLNKEEN